MRLYLVEKRVQYLAHYQSWWWDKKIYQKIKYVLSALGKKITYIGDSGSGQVCKACNQILVAQTIQSISEIINIAKKSNIDPLIREALLAGYANSKILDIHGMRMINQTLPWV